MAEELFICDYCVPSSRFQRARAFSHRAFPIQLQLCRAAKLEVDQLFFSELTVEPAVIFLQMFS